MTDNAADEPGAGEEVLVPDLLSPAGPPDLGALGDLFAGGLPDLGGLMAGMAQVQAAQAETYQGQSGGGAVKVEATGTGHFLSVSISPAVMRGGEADVEMLQDLVLAALNDVTARIGEAQQQAMGGLDLGGLDLGGLFGPAGE